MKTKNIIIFALALAALCLNAQTDTNSKTLALAPMLALNAENVIFLSAEEPLTDAKIIAALHAQALALRKERDAANAEVLKLRNKVGQLELALEMSREENAKLRAK